MFVEVLLVNLCIYYFDITSKLSRIELLRVTIQMLMPFKKVS